MGNLVLSRRTGQSIYVGDDICITVVSVQGNNVKISIEAPREKRILRDEVYQAILQENQASMDWNDDMLGALENKSDGEKT